MKKLLFLFLLIPQFSSAQLVNEVYHHVYERLYHYVSYSQIKKDSIRALKYTLSEKKPISYKDSKGNFKVKLEDYTKYFVEFFDKDGFLIERGNTDSSFEKTNTLTLKIDNKLCSTLNALDDNLKKTISYTSLDNKFEISYSKSNNSCVIKSNLDHLQTTKSYYLNKSNKIIKDSTCRKTPKAKFCVLGSIIKKYEYDENDKLIQKKYFINNKEIVEKHFYNKLGLLEKVEIGDLTTINYKYSSNLKLDLVKINIDGQLSSIDIEYF